MTPRETLAAAGEAAFGFDWQRPLARALGRYHPDGPRASIDDRLVRRWWSGEREIPSWAIAALPALLRAEAAEAKQRADTMQRVAEALERQRHGEGPQTAAGQGGSDDAADAAPGLVLNEDGSVRSYTAPGLIWPKIRKP